MDDNKEMVDYLKDNFKSEYITLIAGNGEEALNDEGTESGFNSF